MLYSFDAPCISDPLLTPYSFVNYHRPRNESKFKHPIDHLLHVTFEQIVEFKEVLSWCAFMASS